MAAKNGTSLSLAAMVFVVLSTPALAQNYGVSAPLQMITPGQQIQGMAMLPPDTNPNFHPVHPLLGRGFQNNGNGGNQQSNNYNNYNYGGGTYSSGNGYSYSTGNGYNPYGYAQNTIIVPSDNGTTYTFGGGGGVSTGGVALGSNGYPLNYGYPSYNIPLTVPDATGPYVTVVPNPPSYDYSGAYLPVPQAAVTNIYNTYNYYPAANPAAGFNPNAVQGSTPASAPTGPSAERATPNTPPAIAGTAGSPSVLKPDDADLLASAYSDIQRGWIRGDVSLIKKHVDMTGSISILSQAKYQYSVPSDKFITSTDNMFDQIVTKSFTVTALQKQTNGDITAFATHVYSLRSADDSDPKKTIYVSYVMSKKALGWVIVAVDSSQSPLTTATSADLGKTLHYSSAN